jgi:conjugative transfer region protein (TIGR03748 family)
MKYRFLSTILFGLLLNNICFASDCTLINKYLTVSNKPKKEQVDVLEEIIQIRFPQNVKTIGSAINYILRFSGYSLITNKKIKPALKITLEKPLPIVDRQLGPMPLRTALIILAGESYNLSVDPLNREINFQLKPSYAKYLRRG